MGSKSAMFRKFCSYLDTDGDDDELKKSEWLDEESWLHGINVLFKYLVEKKMSWLTGHEDLGKRNPSQRLAGTVPACPHLTNRSE